MFDDIVWGVFACTIFVVLAVQPPNLETGLIIGGCMFVGVGAANYVWKALAR